MSYADVNGVSLSYEEHGSGQPLIPHARSAREQFASLRT
jgi:hypothetical protein